MKGDRGGDRGARGDGPAVAAVYHTGPRAAPDAEFAWAALSKQLGVDALGTEVVERRDDRKAALGGGADGRGADQRKGVVDVDDVRTGLVEESAEAFVVLSRPDDAGRKNRPLRR